MILNNLRLAYRLLRRDARCGELQVLMLALVIAVAGTTTVSLMGHRLTRTMSVRAAEFIAADLAVRDHQPLPQAWRDKARELGLQMADAAEFNTVLVEGEDLLLTGVKAVGGGYPLRGELRTARTDPMADAPSKEIPPPGAAWVEPRVLQALHLKLGDTLTVGEKPLVIRAYVTREPDRSGELFSLSPRVMINLQDLAATRVIQPGSHVHWNAQFAGDPGPIAEFAGWLKPQLNPQQHLVDVHQDRPELGNALSRAERYLGLSSVLIVLIAGVAVAMSVRRYTERHFDSSALLKCLGARHGDVLFMAIAQFLMIGLAGSALGCALGYGLQEGAVRLFRGALPHELAPAAWYAPLFGLATGLLILVGFALPPVIRLKRLSPLRVLRRDLSPLPPSAWTVYGLALAAVAALIWRFSGDGRMTAMILGVGLAALAAAGLIALGLLTAGRRLLPALGPSWRFGLQNLTRQPRLGVSQILAFALTLVAMQISLLVRNELVDEWRAHLPEDAPNHFALNLFDADLPAFKNLLQSRGVTSSAFYPIVRGRLVKVNGIDPHGIATKDSQGEGAINRDLSLTFSAELAPDNRLLQGQWWETASDGPPRVSVEAKLAESLKLKLGDRLSFSVGSQQIDAAVASIRSVRWDAMTPNFYMIFQPGSLEGFPRTYLTSFFVPPAEKQILSEMVKGFPAVTLLDVETLIKQLQNILHEVTLAVHFVLAMALAAGFAVLFAAVRLTLDERLREDALMRALGASRRVLRRAHWLEFLSLGFMAGILAGAVAELTVWGLFARVFDLEPRIHWKLWLATPPLGALCVGIAGYWNTRPILRRSPWTVLREL